MSSKTKAATHASVLAKFLVGGALAIAFSAVSAQEVRVGSDELLKRVINADLKNGGKAAQEQMERDLGELMARAKAKEPLAMVSFGWYRKMWCGQFKGTGGDAQTAQMCVDAFSDVKAGLNDLAIASSRSPVARSTLAEMYRDGIGTKPSRYLAADWFIRSAQHRSGNGDREGAVRDLEEALTLVPDHPAGLELRKALLR